MMLGNVSVEKMEQRMGIQFPEPFRSEFAERRQDYAQNVAAGRWHCFDMPFVLMCGDKATMQWIADNLMPYSTEIQEELQVVVNPDAR